MDFTQLTEAEKEYAKAIIECIDDGIFITDGNGTVMEMNHASLGCQKREHIVGRNMRDLVEDGIYGDSIALKVIREKRPISMFQHEETAILTTAMPYIEEGQVKMVVCCERELDELEIMKEQLAESQQKNSEYEQELQHMRATVTRDVGLIAETKEMKQAVELALTAGKFDSRVLITGETGTGKEVIAKLIYRSGKRNGKAFIAVNCGAIPETLLESELFGYEKGAFTGAHEKGKKGLFELAKGGVLLLDEIGEVSTHFQVKLLRVLQENEIIKLGGSETIPVDVQVIAATNKNLIEKVKTGEFRSDLYYRLNVFPIHIAPLRERSGDIVPLVHLFLSRFNEQYGIQKRFSASALLLLNNYEWPGNIRELENVVERLVLVSREDIIRKEEVFPMLFAGQSVHDIEEEELSLEEAVERVEKNILEEYLKKYQNSSQLENVLKISKATLNRKLRKYGLRKE